MSLISVLNSGTRRRKGKKKGKRRSYSSLKRSRAAKKAARTRKYRTRSRRAKYSRHASRSRLLGGAASRAIRSFACGPHAEVKLKRLRASGYCSVRPSGGGGASPGVMVSPSGTRIFSVNPGGKLTAGLQPKNIIGVLPIALGAILNQHSAAFVKGYLPAEYQTGIAGTLVGVGTAGLQLMVPKYGHKLFLGALTQVVLEAAIPYLEPIFSGLIPASAPAMPVVTVSTPGVQGLNCGDDDSGDGMAEFLEENQTPKGGKKKMITIPPNHPAHPAHPQHKQYKAAVMRKRRGMKEFMDENEGATGNGSPGAEFDADTM